MQVLRRPEEGVGAPSLGVIGMENHPSWLQRTELGSSGSPGPARTSETSLQPLSSLDFSATPASPEDLLWTPWRNAILYHRGRFQWFLYATMKVSLEIVFFFLSA